MIPRVIVCFILACGMSLVSHVDIAMCLLLCVCVETLMRVDERQEMLVEQVGTVEEVEHE